MKPTSQPATRLAAEPTLPDEARVLLGRMLLSQAYRELGAINLLESALGFVVDARERAHLHAQLGEERAHLDGALALWAALTGETVAALHARTQARIAERPLPALAGPLDLAMAQFVFDRAGYFQLREYRHSRFAPYAALVEGILADEAEHQDHGARAVVDLGRQSPAAAQQCFTRWLRVSLLSFGRPESRDSARAVALGLKRRAPAAVVADFLMDLVPTMREAGLRWPDPVSLGIELPAGLVFPH